MGVHANTALAAFQDGFVRALRDPGQAGEGELARLLAQPAFAVYRNTVMKGCIDALQANYPAVTRLVGEEWLRAAAAVYVREAPPAMPVLLEYGADFPGFLERFAPAAALPWLPDVARLDRLWTESHIAADAPVLDPGALAGLGPESLAATVLVPHAACRWRWFEKAPIHTLWSRSRNAQAMDPAPDWQAEGSLLLRPKDAVHWMALDAAGCAFLTACADGQPLAGAAQAALEAQPDADLSLTLSTLLCAGAFSRMQPAPPSTENPQ